MQKERIRQTLLVDGSRLGKCNKELTGVDERKETSVGAEVTGDLGMTSDRNHWTTGTRSYHGDDRTKMEIKIWR